MQEYWLKREGNPCLVIFVLGWAADHHAVSHISPTGCDVLCLYDYRQVYELHESDFERYQHKYLFAWSFGVWAAEQILSRVRFTRAVALNGTPFPVDSRYGIEPKRMTITLRGVRNSGTDEFNRRAYAQSYERLKQHLSPRTLQENYDELSTLATNSVLLYQPVIDWNKAVIGVDDVIFTPKNMADYWGIRGELLPLPHYPFEKAELINSEIDNR